MKGKKTNIQQKAGKKTQTTVLNPVKMEKHKLYFALVTILLISFVVYIPAINNSLLGWDDGSYIIENTLIQVFNLKSIFSTYVMGNYHPLTILMLAIEYKIFGLNAAGYHTVNILLHLLNVLLVFYVIMLISEKPGVALIATLLFGVHPLHVESVAWAAELKDLLYTFFFLASLIFYLKYLKGFHKKYYIFALFLFLLSLLSKAMAASLPVLLLLVDHFKGRKINSKSLIDKIPFVVLSVLLGIIAIMAQKNSIQSIEFFTIPQRIVFACYGFISYLVKLLIPLDIRAFYPYPIKSGSGIPIQYYSYLVYFLGLVIAVLYSLKFSKKIFFGIGFFSITVFLVLQLLPVGGAIMADRYSYIPSIGFFYLAGELIVFIWNRKLKFVSLSALGLVTLLFSLKTFSRCDIWENDLTLWNDVIKKDSTISLAYTNRGNYFLSKENYTNAVKDFDRAIMLKSDNYRAYSNRGIIYMKQKKNDEAISDFNKVIELKPDHFLSYNNLGMILMKEKHYPEALKNYDKAIEINPGYAEFYYNRGNLYFNETKYEDAIRDYSKAIELNKDYAKAYFNRGMSAFNAGKKDLACADLKKASALGIQPSSEVLQQVCN